MLGAGDAESLDTVVAGVVDVERAVGSKCDALRDAELAVSGAIATEDEDERPVGENTCTWSLSRLATKMSPVPG